MTDPDLNGHAPGLNFGLSLTWVRILAGVAVFIALLALIGDATGGLDILTRVNSDLPAMVPGTAVTIALLGVALTLHVSQTAIMRRAGLAVSAFAGVLAVAAYGLTGAGAGLADYRMAEATLLALLLLAAAQVAAWDDRLTGWRIHELMGVLAVLLALSGFVGLMIDNAALMRLPLFSGLSLPTAIAVLALAIGVVLSRPEGTSLAILIDPGAGGRTARRTLPWALALPLVFGLIARTLSEAGILDGQQRFLIFTILLALVSCLAVLWLARARGAVLRRDPGSRDTLNAILSGLPDAVLVLDSDGRVANVNAAALRLLGKVPTDRRELLRMAFHAVPEHYVLTGDDHPVQRLWRDEHDILAGWIDPEGHERILNLSGFHLSPENGGFRVIVVADVTEPWQLQQTLARAERMEALGQLAGGVSHELLNIFGVIRLAAEGAQITAPDIAPAAMQSVLNGSQRGAELAERLQKLTVWQGGAMTRIDAGSALRDAVDMARGAVPVTISLECVAPDAQVEVTCDGADLELSVLNLVLNARNAIVEAGMKDGTIHVSLKTVGGVAVIAVRDTGPGIAPGVADRIVEPFYTTRRKFGGTGLGLATVAAFARNAGGEFVIGPAEGGGALAVMRLPLTGGTALRDDEPAGELKPLHGIGLLVVDDDAEFRTLLSDVLAMLGAQVESAHNADSALDILQDSTDIAVMLTDHMLLDGDSGTLLAERAIAVRPELKIIYMSGYRAQDKATKPRVPGLVLRKPLNIAHLSQSIHLIAGGRNDTEEGDQNA